VGLPVVDVLVTVSKRLTFSVHDHILGVVVGEHAVRVGVVPLDEVKIIHAP
jgi:hypothetical protein